MGILTKEVEVRPTGKMIQYYKDKGYDAKYCQPLVVKIDDLPRKSFVVVQALCDMCKEKIMHIRYADYNKSIDNTGSYVCRTCSYIKKEQTNISRYGNNYVKTEEFKEKRKNTYLNKFGVENPMQNKEIMEKACRTNLEKYGYASPSQVPVFKEKARLTTLEHFGVDCASKSEEVKAKIRMTNLRKYGVPYTQQSPEVRVKANETLCKNGTQKTSKQQLYLHRIFGGEINYQISYYSTDICFPEEKLIIEYDGGGHDLRVTLGRLTQEEFKQKEIVRNNIIKREGYKQMRIISLNDKLPSDQVLLQMLSEAKQYFSDYPQHSWIEFNISDSTMRNATHKDGISYDFGELRTIKNSNINITEDNDVHIEQTI